MALPLLALGFVEALVEALERPGSLGSSVGNPLTIWPPGHTGSRELAIPGNEVVRSLRRKAVSQESWQ